MIKEKVIIQYYNSTLSGMFFFPNNGMDRYPVVCKAHGLVSNKFEKEEEIATMLTDEGIVYFAFHFTGFYDSTGVNSIQTSLANLDFVITYLTNHTKVNPLRIGILGVSLGGAIAACHVSRDQRVSALALLAPLFDFEFMVNYPEFDAMWEGLALTGLVRLPTTGVKEKLVNDIKGNNPLNCISKIAPRPLMILAGAKDDFMPIDGIRKLYKKAQLPKRFEIIGNADHNLTNCLARYETFSLIRRFFIEHLLKEALYVNSIPNKVSVI